MDHIQEALLALLGGATLIQISPIRVDPWTWLARKIGRAINGEVIDRMTQMEKRLDKMEADTEERDAKNARTRILRFGDECRRNVRHSQEHFDQVIEDIDNYEEYCAQHPDFKNNKAALTSARIKEAYQRCQKENDFL